jgi:hypothetical protein
VTYANNTYKRKFQQFPYTQFILQNNRLIYKQGSAYLTLLENEEEKREKIGVLEVQYTHYGEMIIYYNNQRLTMFTYFIEEYRRKADNFIEKFNREYKKGGRNLF